MAAAASNNSCLLAPPPLITNQLQLQQPPLDLPPPPPPPAKKKRNLPGTPDPDAEVIALSPRTLLATNRFVCEICGKGFQRDQNLQLHRRGHNLPWKLRQRSGKEPPRKRVYVCPEKTCVHHNPSRALGDLTGIKKHFCRKHGEKKWKCDKCSKRYAVKSDWKAHGKTCGTREYRCDCGTLFSRRDSFITHRAFCDALAEETARLSSAGAAAAAYLLAPPPNMMHLINKPHQPLSLWADPAGGTGILLPGPLGLQTTTTLAPPPPPPPPPQQQLYAADLLAPLGWLCAADGNKLASSNASELTSVASSAAHQETVPSAFSGQQHQHAKPKPAAPAADMSATALLQKAAQMGAVTSGSGGSGSNAMSTMAMAVPMPMPDGGGALLFSASSNQHNATNNTLLISQLTGTMPYDVLSAVRHASLKDAGAAAAAIAVGMREETRDFLGVGVQALCSSSLNGWI